MSRTPKPRLHHHLSREAIARAALDLIDREGLDALSMRGLAAALQVNAMTLYHYVPDKESLVRDITLLLLSELQAVERPGIGWEEQIVMGGRALRELAMRHPHAFPLVAMARFDEPPVDEHARRYRRVLADAGLPEEMQPRLMDALDAYSIGYLLLATQPATPTTVANEADEQVRHPYPDEATSTSEQFDEGTRMIIAGFKQMYLEGTDSQG